MATREFGFRTQPSVTCEAPPEVVYDVIADLRNHLVWSGERAESDGFKMLTLDAPEGQAPVGTTFTSTGAAGKDTFHDSSVVTEATRPSRFVIETDARLERRRAPTWEVHFSHRYDIRPEREGSRIVYTETIERVNYLPYWLKPVIRTVFRPLVNNADRKQLRNLRPRGHPGPTYMTWNVSYTVTVAPPCRTGEPFAILVASSIESAVTIE